MTFETAIGVRFYLALLELGFSPWAAGLYAEAVEWDLSPLRHNGAWP